MGVSSLLVPSIQQVSNECAYSQLPHLPRMPVECKQNQDSAKGWHSRLLEAVFPASSTTHPLCLHLHPRNSSLSASLLFPVPAMPFHHLQPKTPIHLSKAQSNQLIAQLLTLTTNHSCLPSPLLLSSLNLSLSLTIVVKRISLRGDDTMRPCSLEEAAPVGPGRRSEFGVPGEEGRVCSKEVAYVWVEYRQGHREGLPGAFGKI